MPNLDVSELYSDPDFATTFRVLRRLQTIDNYGMNTPSQEVFEDVVGVIYMEDSSGLDIMPEAQTTPRVIEITTNFALQQEARDGLNDTIPDIIEFLGTDYLVKAVVSFGHFGPGFVRAKAESIAKADWPEGSEGVV